LPNFRSGAVVKETILGAKIVELGKTWIFRPITPACAYKTGLKKVHELEEVLCSFGRFKGGNGRRY
jgi:hypothetical protein